jgi:quercetin dioxygenase-like cupin family protein
MNASNKRHAAWKISAAEGTVRSLLGDRLTYKGRITGCNLHLAECVIPPGGGVPIHRHPSPETFILREGRLLFTLGDGDSLHESEASAGDVVAAQSMAWHAFRNTSAAPAVFTIVYDDSLEAFFEDVGAGVKPFAAPTQERIAHVLARAAAHGMQVKA